MSQHNLPWYTRARRLVCGGALALGTVVTGVALAAPASAAGHDWGGVAACESSGNWHANTGNGFYGGLQFTPSTWQGYGGGAYASRADLATPAQQIAVAERVLAGQGRGAWPVCGAQLTSGSTTVAAAPAQPRRAAPVASTPSSGGTYVVRPGDTLSSIAAAQGISGGWRELWARNSGTVSNPNLIYVGEQLAS